MLVIVTLLLMFVATDGYSSNQFINIQSNVTRNSHQNSGMQNNSSMP